MSQTLYTEDTIKTLDWQEHIRTRPGMYIGKKGDGSAADDGIYILLKEVIDNSIDEFMMGAGRRIDIDIAQERVSVRDYGRGIPLGKLADAVGKMNTGGKYDSRAFQKSVGMNGVGTKAVNALSSFFSVTSYREGQMKTAEFSEGRLKKESEISATAEKNGVLVVFELDKKFWGTYQFHLPFVVERIKHYGYLNKGLKIRLNGALYESKKGLWDLLTEKVQGQSIRYPIIHLEGEDIEVAITHGNDYGEELYSFVNGQYTTQGGTHQQAFREAFVKVVRDFFKKDFDAADIRQGIVAALSIKVIEPVFESQTKTKLGSLAMAEGGKPIKSFIMEFLARHLDNFLHRHPESAEALRRKIIQSELERKELSGIKKKASERAKKASLHNQKLRDCRYHLNDPAPNNKNKADIIAKQKASTLFITEGNSASGSITKVRDVGTQAVFSLKGKPQNVFGMGKRVAYENEELNLLLHALNIEQSVSDLRYNYIVLATDADDDGMHIRLLLMSFFLQFFPDLVRGKHIYILETPLFRVRNKQKTLYCYNEPEKMAAIETLGGKLEITRFKGLGEISPDEFAGFIGTDMRLRPVYLLPTTPIQQLLSFYVGKNTDQRRAFIIENLRVEELSA